jgi:hypothetical protein
MNLPRLPTIDRFARVLAIYAEDFPPEDADDEPTLNDLVDMPDDYTDEQPLRADAIDALLPDDDYEPAPEPGDFWIERDVA